MEAQGYNVWPYVLPAAGINAPHQRDRVWFVARRRNNASPVPSENLAQAGAHPDSDRCNRLHGKRKKLANESRENAQHDVKPLGISIADPDSKRLERRKNARNAKAHWQKHIEQLAGFYPLGNWRDWQTQSPVCGGDDGLPLQLDGITFSKWRMNSIKMYGNAIVPQVAYRIFRAIKDFEEHHI
ncbi:hypothetical protein GCM10023093_27480 [Nemorincola caseinilytica]|uniref:DNA (cytosine-5-)-methyltransferase n=1 Tax=Nemorincola caseinilytica TaxID=2054315 RepID=A0ABP8NPZ3_9BACT